MKAPTRKEIDKSLKYSIKEGSANAVKDGIEGNYIIPFAMALGATNEMVGILSSVPDMVGVFFQTISAKLIKIFRSKKTACRTMKFIGNFVWLPIIFLPLLAANALILLLLFMCIRAVFYNIDDTLWSSWIADIIPKKIRGSFIGKRNIFVNATAFLSSLIAGWILGIIDNLSGFMLIFAIAFAVNFISIYLLGKIIEAPIKNHPRVKFSFRHFVHGIRHHSNYSNFVFFRMFMNFAIYIASPFWIVYVLRNLGIGYFWYGVSIAVYMIINILSQKHWGRMIDRFGEKKIMFVCAFLIPFAALVMIFITNVWQLMIERVFSGFVYAGFSLASFNYLLSASPSDDSATFIANYKVFAGLGASAAPLVGGLLVTFFAATSFLGLGAIQILFLIAALMRFMIAGTMLRRLHSIRVHRHIAFRNVFMKTAFIFPAESIFHQLNYVAHSIHKWEENFKNKLFK